MRCRTIPSFTVPNCYNPHNSRLQNKKSVWHSHRFDAADQRDLWKFLAGFESIVGGEVTAFTSTSEMEKARWEAIERVKARAVALGANAIIGLDVETSDLGLQNGIVLFSATGTAVVVEPEKISGNVPV